MVVVVVLPLAKLVVEALAVVDDDAVEEPVKFFGVDAVGALYLAVQPRGAGLDVDVLEALVQGAPVERGLELGTVVCLDDLDPERQPPEDVVEEGDRGLLVGLGVDLEHAEPGAVVDRGELVVATSATCGEAGGLHDVAV
nr:hypothetical protein [Pseudonocardia nigra]